MATSLRTSLEHHRKSALMALRAVQDARTAARTGFGAVVTSIAAHQAAQARMSELDVAQMLAEQAIDQAAEALLNSAGFLSSVEYTSGSLAAVGYTSETPQGAESFEFERLVASLVQDAGRAAEQVAVATRQDVGWVRTLTPPSCSRCVVLAGRVYRWSDGFMRHPGDDCVTTPVREGDDRLTVDPLQMVRDGQVRGLSKADTQALRDGAGLGQVVNVRLKSSGLSVAGQTLVREGRPTPAGIYAAANGDREKALGLLATHGYIL